MAQENPKIYLMVADETEELNTALRFTCALAKERGSKIGVLYTVDNQEFSHWGKIETLIQNENRLKAEKFILSVCEKIQNTCGMTSVIFLEQGKTAEAIIKVIDENPNICRLLLGGSTKGGDPGPLVKYFSTKGFDKLKVPLGIIPDTLTEDRFGD
ncbi:MAG: universal stress protein [Alphaproteobacteria bacterium]